MAKKLKEEIQTFTPERPDRSNDREATIEGRIVSWARRRGWITAKLRFIEAGWPDRLFVNKYGYHIYMETKVPGKEPRELQYQRINELRERGVNATWTDDSDDGIYYLRQHENHRPIHSTPLPSQSDQNPDQSGGSGAVPRPGVGEDS
jgi:hypothetical protein